MKRNILFCLLVLFGIQTVVSAATYSVNPRFRDCYPTIESALNDPIIVSDDTIIVAPETYTPRDPNPPYGYKEYDFGGKNIILISEINPANPDSNTIAETIIDCQGSKDNPIRAFRFHSGETNSAKVLGFTIINGYREGPVGIDGGNPGDVPGTSINPEDPCNYPPDANGGTDVTGSEWGGGFLIDSASSPTIEWCVIKNCIVTGARGGDGGDGENGPWGYFPDPNDPNAPLEPTDDGQWGGSGGTGSGTGYGGAIACKGGSSPIIRNCRFESNQARGGVGGRGGDGGRGTTEDGGLTYSGYESFGGDANDSIGDGRGGAIYAENSSNPVVSDCIFINNIAATGFRSEGGSRGEGTAIGYDFLPPNTAASGGNDGFVWGLGDIAGGAVYHNNVDADYTKCEFTANKAYETGIDIDFYTGQEVLRYTIGGGLYSAGGVNVILDSCKFVDNMGGAIYCGSNTTLNINNATDPNTPCLFTNNSAPNECSDFTLPCLWGNDLGSGGAIYLDTGCAVDIQNSIFSGNTSKNDGGAIKSESDIATLGNCSFSANQSGRYGGAIDLYKSNTPLTIDANNCSFYGNQSQYGGAFSSENFTANIADSYFIGNTALFGGAMDLVNGSSVTITGGFISENTTTASYGTGGGIDCSFTAMTMQHCTIQNNTAEGDNATGGAINLYGGYGGIQHVIQNCLITGNYAGSDGGAIACIVAAVPDINNCTFSDNSAGSFGGAIFADFSSNPTITNGIFNNCNGHAIHEEDYGGDATVTYSLFYNNPDGDYYDSVAGLVCVGFIPWGSYNLYGDPLFFGGPLGSYYLMQTATGDTNQFADSPAVDAGKTVSGWDHSTYTTRTDSVGDSGQVDMGYHYPFITDVNTFELVIDIVSGNGGIEIISPAPLSNPSPGVYTFYAGTMVTIQAVPDAGWRVESWSGTKDDSSVLTTNYVVMDADKTVELEFKLPQTISVPGQYSSIQQAFDAAGEGDTILVDTGTYITSTGYNIEGKNVTIKSKNPDDPDVVAGTVIELEVGDGGGAGRAFTFTNVGPDTVLNGITIRGFSRYGIPGEDGEGSGADGRNGINIFGGAILCRAASTTIKNCVIVDCNIIGGDGGDGTNGSDPNLNGGNGGWPGVAYGGGLACMSERNTDGTISPSNPAVINCTFRNNSVIGGNGGDGGDGGAENGVGGYGGGWYYSEQVDWEYGYHIIDAWFGLEGDGQYDFYTRYSGLGGAVYVGQQCAPTFNNCTFSNNSANGGTCGIRGINEWSGLRPEPSLHWKIDTFGGAVYCDTNSVVEFTDCDFTDNVADTNYPADNDDPYVSLGGAVACQDGADVTFNNCRFNDNLATIGGGIYTSSSKLSMNDSEFTANSAYSGGGLYMVEGDIDIINCDITGNTASGNIDPNDANDIIVLGDGGGIYCNSSGAYIAESLISYNESDKSGGGVYIAGDSQSTLFNCLIVNNQAGRDGAGVSVNWDAQIDIFNCTITNNIVTGTGFITGYGGGLYCSYGAYTEIINSIIWDNSAYTGSQITIGSGFEFDPVPSTVKVTYSNIDGGDSDVWVDTDCVLDWDVDVSDPNYPTNIDANSLFVDGYHLSHIDAGQSGDSPCIDVGSTDVYIAGLYQYTTRTDLVCDTGTVDMGYHYSLPDSFVSDFDVDGDVDLDDIAFFLLHWLDTGCDESNGWCFTTDFNYDGTVNFPDYAVLASEFGMTEDIAPTPDPMTWESVPVSYPNVDWIAMTASTAVDNYPYIAVEYYFQADSGGGHDSGWQSSTEYTDTGLTIGDTYGYRVKARDERGNETGWSVEKYADAGVDDTPPVTDPNAANPYKAKFENEPNAISESAIEMSAVEATDETGVEYYFECVSGNCHDRDWNTDRTYTDTGLDPNTTYTYRVRTCDTSLYQNLGDYSDTASATTGIVDNPPSQAPAITLTDYYISLDDYYHRITVNVSAVDDDNTPGDELEINFICDHDSSLNSGWVLMLGTGSVTLSPGRTITYESSDIVRYDALIPDQVSMPTYNWKVCVRDASEQQVCTDWVLVGP